MLVLLDLIVVEVVDFAAVDVAVALRLRAGPVEGGA